MSESIDVFIDRKVVVLKESDKVKTAARAMCENQVGCVIVANEDSKISGILTDRDIVCNLISTDLETETSLEEIMETDVVFLNEFSTIEEATSLMKERGIRRLPIVEESKKGHQKCIGVITLDDLMAGEFISTKDLSDIVKSQILRKKQILHKPVRGDSRIDQTYNKFISQVSKEIQLENEKTEEVARFILSSIIQRLHYSGGVQFISQLPKRFQEDLLDLPAGPDRAVTDKSVVQGISIRTGKGLKTSRVIALKFWKSLYKLLGPGETDHVIHQLPNKMKDLFVEPSQSESQTPLPSVTAESQVRSQYE